MKIKEQIVDYFAGIITHKISAEEQKQFNILFRRVRKATTVMLKREAIKIRRQCD